SLTCPCAPPHLLPSPPRRSSDLGFNCVDTADVYSKWKPGNKGGESETIIGNWFKARGNRANVILASKCGLEMAPDKKGLSKAYIDRKSTRLNSSHVKISYAVFCL